jgi:hypothetical protein
MVVSITNNTFNRSRSWIETASSYRNKKLALAPALRLKKLNETRQTHLRSSKGVESAGKLSAA